MRHSYRRSQPQTEMRKPRRERLTTVISWADAQNSDRGDEEMVDTEETVGKFVERLFPVVGSWIPREEERSSIP